MGTTRKNVPAPAVDEARSLTHGWVPLATIGTAEVVMKPIISLRSLPEPAYILLGGLLPRDGDGDQHVLRSRDRVLTFGHGYFPAFEPFSRLRGQSEAVEFAAEHGSQGALDALVAAGTLIRFPEDDESGVRRTLEPLCVRIIAPARVASDGQTVLFQVNADQTVAAGPLTMMVVLTNDGVRSLKTSVAAAAEQWGLDEHHVWRAVIHDLTGMLMTGVVNLAEVPA